MKTTIYNYLHGRLWLKANRDGEIGTDEAKILIGRRHNIPKPLRYNILKEMNELNLLKWKNSRLIQLLKKPKIVLGNALEGYEIKLF